MKRREFVGTLALALVLLCVALILWRGRLKSRLVYSRPITRLRTQLYEVDVQAGTGPLTPDEERRLWSLAVVVLPSGIDASSQLAVMDHLRWRASQTAGYRAAFVDGLELLDRETNRIFPGQSRFDELRREEADKVIAALWTGIRPYPRHRELVGDLVRFLVDRRHMERFRLRRHVVNEIFHAFYSSRAGWALVGYDSYAGRCGGLDSYSRPPSGSLVQRQRVQL